MVVRFGVKIHISPKQMLWILDTLKYSLKQADIA